MSNQLKLVLLTLFITYGSFAQMSSDDVLTLCWDTSLSMNERDLNKELSFIDSIITARKVSRVQLLNFSNQVQEENFTIDNGDWSALKQKLSSTEYDGATNYQELNRVTKTGKTLVFTDGNKILDKDFLSLDREDILINSSSKANHKILEQWEYLNRISLFDYTANTAAKNDSNADVIKGFVYLDGKSLSRALIASSSGSTVVTDTDGKFQLKGRVGDTLWINAGKDGRQQLVVNNPEDDLNFFLDSKTVQLDEVTVSEAYAKELETVNTGFNQIERKKVGFAVYDIPEERISSIETTVSDVLEEVPGLMMSSEPLTGGRGGGLSTAKIRGKTSMNFDSFALVVIDGTPMQRTTNSMQSVGNTNSNADYSFIDPQNIKSIQVLKGLAATNLFGSEGKGGVILITTKTGSSNEVRKKPIDQARLTNNIFEGKLIAKKGQLNTPYLNELKKAKDLKAAYAVYLEQRKQYVNDYWYFIDVSDYFRTANSNLADKVLSNVLELPFDYHAHRTLYLKYMEYGHWDAAFNVAEVMEQKFPKNIQTYLDKAVAQKLLGNYQAAAHILNGMLTGELKPEVDFIPLKKVASTELRNLVSQHRDKIDLSKIDANYQNNVTYNARLRFDWANHKNEFILKFVNPQKRFFDWEHSSSSDKKGILEEIQNGFGTNQFELVGEMVKGKWGVYITNLSGSGLKEPYWVKCAVDYNYGKPNQHTEEKVIRLDASDDKEQLFFEISVD